MAMNARKYSTYIQQPIVTPQPTDRPEPNPNKKIFTKGEKVLFVLFVSIFTLFSLMILEVETSIHASNRDIQTIENQIDETKKQNTDLSIQVSELSTYESVWGKAKALGLKLNEKNVKVVSGQ